jgi:hypothetical protein
MTFARFQAITAAMTAAGEWTAPATPVVLLCRKWPDPVSGDFKRGQDAFVIGTIGDPPIGCDETERTSTFFGGRSFSGFCRPAWVSPLRSLIRHALARRQIHEPRAALASATP